MPELSIEKLQLFMLVIMPGIIAIKVFDLRHPPDKRDFGSSLMEAVVFGLINFAIWVWPLLAINKKGFPEDHPVWYAVCSFGFLVLSPATLAYLAAGVRNQPWFCKKYGYPCKTAWDDFFKRQPECWILFHLKNGKLVGGYFGSKSYATSFPQPPELYVEEVWRIDDQGRFIEKVDGTFGMAISMSDCERLEFLTVEESKENGES